MPPSAEHNLVSHTSGDNDTRNRKRLKILQQVKIQQGLSKLDWRLDSMGMGCAALLSYLIKEKDTSIVDYVLAPLVDTTVPQDLAAIDEKQVFASVQALTNLTNIMFVLAGDGEVRYIPDDISSYKFAVFSTLCDKWPAVISWLRTLMLHFWRSPDAYKMTGNCVELFKATLIAYLDNGYAEEIFSLPCTIDFIYPLVCRAEAYPGLDVAIYPVFAIVAVLTLSLESDACSSVALRLSTVSQATRSTVIGALVRRAREFADHGANKRHLRRKDLRCDAPKRIPNSIPLY